MSRRYLHDHDEELGCYWFGDPPPSFAAKPKKLPDFVKRHVCFSPPPNAATDRLHNLARLPKAARERPHPRPRDESYWNETARLVTEYFVLQAGAHYSDPLHEAFKAWLERTPAERSVYENGEDMARAAQVDWFLKVVR
jgi:hypothetical protein